MTEQEFNSSRYALRLLFTKKLVNKPGQADRVIEFIDAKSEHASGINKEYWVKKEVERPKFRPHEVVEQIRKAGYPSFRLQPDHVDMWKREDAKNPAKGYGVMVSGAWFWYESWILKCVELCKAADSRFTASPALESVTSAPLPAEKKGAKPGTVT